ncbi:MAG: ComEC/Rec2 family competence protein, partial [Pirellulales bacterium]
MDASAPAREGPRYQPLVIVLAAVCAGMAGDRFAPWPAQAWWAVAAGGWLAWLVLWRRGRERAAAAWLLIALAAAGGAWRHAQWHLFDQNEIGLYAGDQPVAAMIEATLISGPRRVPAPAPNAMRAIESGDRTRMLVRVTALRDGDAWLPASGRSLLLVNGHLLGVSVGDRLRIACRLSAPAGPRNPGEFDFARHARGRRQLSLLSADFPQCVTVTARRARWSIGQWFENLRTGGDEALWRRLAHERSGLAAALLLGAREQLDQETTDAFARTGTIHLLSISGLHVAILAGALFWTL